ncbi:MAG TPA: hypothetical protein PKI14_05995 [Fervidobacterium sp.]|nr:hypothetical protein [Fervidobacterium sp.]HPT54293.1 hypothetical protein [Fervidobacterium sp.]HQE48625.1 hypothetical protein [Fervidobacterium sp.]HUM42479.1 hypothetical protein [Fervidobacterium sp.]
MVSKVSLTKVQENDKKDSRGDVMSRIYGMRRTLFMLMCFAWVLFSNILIAEVIDEETARHYFSQALVETYTGNFEEAYKISVKAISGRVYVQELPYFWYLRGRLGIITGTVDKALEELKSFTQLVMNDEIENILSKVQYFRMLDIASPGTFKFGYVNSLSGRQSNADYFQTPTSLSVFGDVLYILDSRNKRLVSAKNNRILKVKKLSREYKQVFAARDGSIYLVTDDALYDGEETELVKALKAAVVAGSDRDGNVYIVDIDRIIVFDREDKTTKSYKLDQRLFCLDAEMTVDKIYVLDGVRQQIFIYDLQTMKRIGIIEVPEKAWNFEVTPYGDLIYLTNNKIIAGNQEFEAKDVNFIEYSYPTLFTMKWKGNIIDQYFLKDDKPLFVSIDKMMFDDTYSYAYIRVEDLYGDEIHYIQYALGMLEQDVYVPSDIYCEFTDVKLVNLKTCSNELVSYRMAGIKTFGGCAILNKFTGSLPSLKNKQRLVFVARWNYIRPVPPGVVKVTAKVSFKDLMYFDSMFYTNQLMSEPRLRK